MLFNPLKNNQGVALVFMVLLFAAAAAASIMLLSVGIKVKSLEEEGITQARLDEIRNALRNYYLIHYDLPDPSATTPAYSVPTVSLNLPQKYRFDSNGQMIRYDRLPRGDAMATVRNIEVHGSGEDYKVGAVLVAPGPDKTISEGNRSSPYDDPVGSGGDDLVVAVSLEAEALKVAKHAVAVLQQTAKAYDAIFYGKNNDLDTLYYPPETRWVDDTPPELNLNNLTEVSIDPESLEYEDIEEYVNDPVNYDKIDGDEYVEPVSMSTYRLQPVAYIDEGNANPDGGYVAAEGGGGSGCIRIAEVGSGVIWSNDPSRGVASLDDCSSGTPAYDLAVAYGLNLAKLGYDAATTSLLDPWGNRYLWGASTAFSPFTYNATEAQDLARDPHYWSFYSLGPDGKDDTPDDILPAADRIPGYWLTPEIVNPFP